MGSDYASDAGDDSGAELEYESQGMAAMLRNREGYTARPAGARAVCTQAYVLCAHLCLRCCPSRAWTAAAAQVITRETLLSAQARLLRRRTRAAAWTCPVAGGPAPTRAEVPRRRNLAAGARRKSTWSR